MLTVTVTVSALAANHQAGFAGSQPTPTNASTSSTPTSQSSTPTPFYTSKPSATTPPPDITPGATSLLPSDCKISYAESGRIYDSLANITEVSFYVVLMPDFSSRGTYYLYPARFVLKENGNVVSLVNPDSTSDGIGLSENNGVTTTVIVRVQGNYTSNNYELNYYNPPPNIIFRWIKFSAAAP